MTLDEVTNVVCHWCVKREFIAWHAYSLSKGGVAGDDAILLAAVAARFQPLPEHVAAHVVVVANLALNGLVHRGVVRISGACGRGNTTVVNTSC